MFVCGLSDGDISNLVVIIPFFLFCLALAVLVMWMTNR